MRVMRAITNLLLTGVPRVGKTTVIKQVIDGAGLPFGGFYTEEIREGDQRVGFRIITTDGKEGILAHVRIRSRYVVGKYGVNIEDVKSVAMPAIQRALDEGKVIVIDEIASMELYCPGFPELVIQCLDSPQPLLGAIQLKPLPFLKRIREREDVEVINVTPFNRNELPSIVSKRLWEMWLQWRSSLQQMRCSGS
ncbi:MAG: NTPase [Armatimonadota bacterium]|nr:NTPase [Armatimonadota bacterium]MCX7777597.1 NTPase [Armatimonadota bacterium]MDW8024725.1 NTPase [Armatimonadota bacterium]